MVLHLENDLKFLHVAVTPTLPAGCPPGSHTCHPVYKRKKGEVKREKDSVDRAKKNHKTGWDGNREGALGCC